MPAMRIALLSYLFITGCVSTDAVLIAPQSKQQATCLQFYQDLDDAVFANDAEDTGEMRIPGFPYLRGNRFFASFAGTAMSDSAYAQWLEQMRQLDENARLAEFANLPRDAAAGITSRLPAGSSFRQRLNECGLALVGSDSFKNPEYKTELADRVAVPDNYKTWQRVAGAYPLLRWFAGVALDDLHNELNAPFQLPIEQIPVSGKPIRYAPPRTASMTRQEAADRFAQAYRNPLQIPLFETEQLDILFAQFAPAWEIDTRNETDLIGTVTLDADGKPSIDTKKPTVYVKHSYTRFHGENLLQLIYQVWMPAREKTGTFDLYGGELDSVIWRVTLNSKGLPIVYDSIHACGCYYKLFPANGFIALPNADGTEAVLSPKRISVNPYETRLLLRLSNRTHYLQQVTVADAANATPYRFEPYDNLRSLPIGNNERRNLFGPECIIEASRRAERFLLWPFGVASPGAMRQWGSHAIAFVGRRHFDDAFLLEQLIAPEK